MNKRDLEKYLADFQGLAFEGRQSFYRQKFCIDFLNSKSVFKNVIEVGCGSSSIFKNVSFQKETIVDPIYEFTQIAASDLANKCTRIFNCRVEDLQCEERFDLVIASCLLHEVEDPSLFLKSLSNILAPGGSLYVDVPNARSLHRFVAVETGYLENIYSKSSTQIKMQQSGIVFDKQKLTEILEDNGFLIVECGGYFVKPFHHEKMQALLDNGIFTEADLLSFYKLGTILNDFESEIFCFAEFS